MTYIEVLRKKRSAILERWLELVLDSYSPQASKFMHSEKDRFANPVGHSIKTDIEIIFELIVDERFEESPGKFPEGLVKIRAVQDFIPSEAIGFVFRLKEALDELTGDGLTAQDRRLIDGRIDKIALRAFDEYVKCRERVFQIRVGEIQKRYSGARD